VTSESVLELITERQDRMCPSERKVAAAMLAAPTDRPISTAVVDAGPPRLTA
jgi:DNA-binding MurR/RpiR family transcriptional regulator